MCSQGSPTWADARTALDLQREVFHLLFCALTIDVVNRILAHARDQIDVGVEALQGAIKASRTVAIKDRVTIAIHTEK